MQQTPELLHLLIDAQVESVLIGEDASVCGLVGHPTRPATGKRDC
jgi:hypothetical protein